MRHVSTRRIAVLGIALNLLLSVFKIVVGLTASSQAILADGLNNAGDIFSSLMTLVGNYLAGKPSDREHPYGHGKAEYIFSLIISFSMILVAYQTLTGAVAALREGAQFRFSIWIVAVSAVSILAKGGLHIYSRRVNKSLANPMLYAVSEDSRNDIIISAGVIAGAVCGYFGVYFIDGAVGLVIALWIFYSGLRVFAGAYGVLMDADINAGLKAELERVIADVEGVDHIDSVMAKPVGVNYILIVKISVNGDMHVNEAHAVTAVIKHAVIDKRRIADVIVHVNPA